MDILTDPRILYMVLVLPGLFGITLTAEGLAKVVSNEWQGLISLFFGLLFLGIVVGVYFLFKALSG